MPLTIGQTLQNRYRILGLLGQGGMGAVYLAEDLRLPGRRCAIKENVPDPQASPQALAQLRQQFLAEASILAQLDHPNLPKVSDYFTQGGNEYLVMDYVEGENLQSVLDRWLQQYRQPLPERSVLPWFDQVLDALAYLHSQQPYAIIHRDIKPGNIILTPKGTVKLVDFGLVKLLDPQQPGTATVVKGFGTPEYAALEQHAQGAHGHTDARTDIYALGATLYHLLTGAAPPDAVQLAVKPGNLIPPRRANPALSAAAEASILKALKTQPDERFQSAGAMRTALSLATVTTVSQPKTGKRMPGWLLGVVVGVAMALLILVGWQVLDLEPPALVTSVPTLAVVSTVMPPISATIATPTSAIVIHTSLPPTEVISLFSDTVEPSVVDTPMLMSTATLIWTPTIQGISLLIISPTLNVRGGPGTNYGLIGQAREGERYEVTGRNAAGNWYQISLSGEKGWVTSQFVQLDGDPDSLALATNIPTPPVQPTRPPAPVQQPASQPTPVVTPRPTYPFALVQGVERCAPNSGITYFDGFVRRRDNSLLNGVCVHIAFFGPRNTKCSGCGGVGNGVWGFSPFGGPAPPGTIIEIFVVDCPGTMPLGGQSEETGFGDLTPRSEKWVRTINASEQCTGITFVTN